MEIVSRGVGVIVERGFLVLFLVEGFGYIVGEVVEFFLVGGFF